ncbi:DUF3305 domain-containing protein [Futiania mangrovi]|uniref:DUF3305 domain-containing protein n=1 Tax=Futiania mangrovi TaxID=2959716 RepID=A0A9J6PH40_9PROT|nr:DUF3305 domain-containing protein [Futiania mangrovii]MCP1335410.1 DUF3305 domain-containing protein [Futiania mangrovii]
MSRVLTIPLGVIVERRPAKNPWADHVLRAIAVTEDPPPDLAPWTLLVREGEVERYHAGTAQIELHRKETEAYLENFLDDRPQIFVVLRRDDEDDASPFGFHLFCVSASPFYAQNLMDSGEDIVDPVPMPAAVAQRVRAFVDFHHVEEPFAKRKRRKAAEPDEVFARPPGWSPAGGDPWEN